MPPFHQALKITLEGKHYYYPYLTDREIEVQSFETVIVNKHLMDLFYYLLSLLILTVSNAPFPNNAGTQGLAQYKKLARLGKAGHWDTSEEKIFCTQTCCMGQGQKLHARKMIQSPNHLSLQMRHSGIPNCHVDLDKNQKSE